MHVFRPLLPLLLFAASTAAAQIPEKFENLLYYPKDIPRDSLIQAMRGFSFALGVRCQFCHAGGDGTSLRGVNFASDDKVAKQKARFMLRMKDSINTKLLAALPQRSNPPITVSCMTCHRGLSEPSTLEQTLARTITAKGVDSAVAQYRLLRQSIANGTYDFSEQSMNELARQLTGQGKTAEAVAMLELNQEFYPGSAEIDFTLAELHAQRGERDKSISRYRMTLQKNPNHQRARARLTALGVTP